MRWVTRKKLLTHGKNCSCRSFDRYVVIEGPKKFYFYACRKCQWRVKEGAGRAA